jgi:hypothetical protein
MGMGKFDTAGRRGQAPEEMVPPCNFTDYSSKQNVFQIDSECRSPARTQA